MLLQCRRPRYRKRNRLFLQKHEHVAEELFLLLRQLLGRGSQRPPCLALGEVVSARGFDVFMRFAVAIPRRVLVPGGGVEPPRAEARRILSPLRLPVPPSRLSA
jgi:hypothetical protein